MSKTHYRMAETKDALELASLRWGLRTDDAPVFDAAHRLSFVKAFVKWMESAPDKDLVHWVAEQAGSVIGVVSVRVIHKMPSPEEFDGKFGYVTNSYVLPAHRNASVGTGLLTAVKDWALNEGLELLVVWPSDG